MPNIIISGVPGLDGSYPLDLNFTHRDFHDIKRISGIRANEVQDALVARDVDLIVAMAAIALRRAGRFYDLDQLWDSEVGGITLDASDDEEEVDESGPPPPDESPRPEPESSPSGPSTSASSDASPATSSPALSGTPQQVSGSASLRSST